MRILDLFCCQGGAAKGYADAGFEVVGVDIEPQPRYPFPFIQRDVFDYLAAYGTTGFDAVHASPPCQAYSATQRIQGNAHPALIALTRKILHYERKPYVIENVPDARDELRDPVMLCGAMFPGLRVYRHRLFECSFPVTVPLHPAHVAPQVKMGRAPKPGEWVQAVGNFSGADEAREAMEMPWASRNGLREAIPPAYTEFIGRQLRAHIEASDLELAA